MSRKGCSGLTVVVIDIKTSGRVTGSLIYTRNILAGSLIRSLKISEIKKGRNINDSVMTGTGCHPPGRRVAPRRTFVIKNVISKSASECTASASDGGLQKNEVCKRISLHYVQENDGLTHKRSEGEQNIGTTTEDIGFKNATNCQIFSNISVSANRNKLKTQGNTYEEVQVEMLKIFKQHRLLGVLSVF